MEEGYIPEGGRIRRAEEHDFEELALPREPGERGEQDTDEDDEDEDDDEDGDSDD